MTEKRTFGFDRSSTDNKPGEEYERQLGAETDSAWGLVDEPAGTLIWLPKSVCHRTGGSTQLGAVIKLWVPDWLAEKRGLA